MLGGRLLHGGDYNPDQWLAYPEVFEEDVLISLQGLKRKGSA